MRHHVVRQGEYLDQLAFRFGFDADAVWNDAKNAALKAARCCRNTLLPGDVLFIPGGGPAALMLETSTTNIYVADVPVVAVKLRFVLEDESPIANEAYFVSGIDDEAERTTDGQGVAHFDAPVTARQVQVVFPQRYVGYTILIGDLNPMESASGFAMRLANLGYGNFAPATAPSPDVIVEFQQDRGIPETGILDDETRAAITTAYGM